MSSNCDRMERTTELRHVSNKYLIQLSNILNTLDSWKELMAAIPKCQKSPTEFDESTNQTKYKYSEIKEIELASRSMKQQPTLILFDEWGTSGRVRPTIAHLLILLVRLEMYRAADFVAREMLKETAPVRPDAGPAARVDISLVDKTTKVIDSTLEEPSVIRNTLANQMEVDKITPSMVNKVEQPEPLGSLMQFSKNMNSAENLDGPPNRVVENMQQPSPVLFATETSNNNNHMVSNRTQTCTQSQSVVNLPNLGCLNLGSRSVSTLQTDSKVYQSNIPDLPGLMNNNSNNSLLSSNNNNVLTSANIPNIPVLMNQSEYSHLSLDQPSGGLLGESSDTESLSNVVSTSADFSDHEFGIGTSSNSNSIYNIPNLSLSGNSSTNNTLPDVINSTKIVPKDCTNETQPTSTNEIMPDLSFLIPK